MDEYMILRRLNIEIQGYPESYAAGPDSLANAVGSEARAGIPSSASITMVPSINSGSGVIRSPSGGGPATSKIGPSPSPRRSSSNITTPVRGPGPQNPGNPPIIESSESVGNGIQPSSREHPPGENVIARGGYNDHRRPSEGPPKSSSDLRTPPPSFKDSTPQPQGGREENGTAEAPADKGGA
mmetsp:Transcript_34449/g.79647  ORF Transcript_34449/g.79647 Transcript_34449/m.79647 type:complete len:183 (-) Transcript_34449:222-770(-)